MNRVFIEFPEGGPIFFLIFLYLFPSRRTKNSVPAILRDQCSIRMIKPASNLYRTCSCRLIFRELPVNFPSSKKSVGEFANRSRDGKTRPMPREPDSKQPETTSGLQKNLTSSRRLANAPNPINQIASRPITRIEEVQGTRSDAIHRSHVP